MNFVKFKNKKIFILLIVLGIVFMPFFANAASGGIGGYWEGQLLDILSTIVYVAVGVVGKLIGLVVELMMSIAEYNNFIYELPVTTGWRIVVDLCNMGFVLVLLIIAVASILQIQSYNYRTWLPKLILMAILINFSRVIAGVLIDASEVVMLTFVNGIANLSGSGGASSFMDALGINAYLSMDINFSDQLQSLRNKEADEVSAWSIAITIILALLVSLIALVVVSAITIILLIRIVALWVLIILSPFAYLFSASPAGHAYASQWWQKFTKWTTTGPVMIFFVWLGLKTVKATHSHVFGTLPNNTQVGLAAIGSSAVMGAFLLSSIMLMASLVVAQQLGGLAARVAGGAYNMITTKGDKFMRGATRAPLTASKAALNLGVDKLHAKTGIDLNFKRVWEGVKAQRASNRAKDYLAGQRAASDAQSKGGRLHGILAMSGNPGEAWNYIANWKNFKEGYYERRKGGKQMTRDRKEAMKELNKLEFGENFIKSDNKEQREKLKKLRAQRAEIDRELNSAGISEDKKRELEKKKGEVEERIQTGEKLEQEGFKSGFVNKTKREQADELDKLWNERDELEDKLLEDMSDEERELLEKSLEELKDRIDFSEDAYNNNINTEKAQTDENVKKIIDDYQENFQKLVRDNDLSMIDSRKKALKDTIGKNTPQYSFDAASARDRLVREEMSKISDIKNSDILNSMLKEAIEEKDKVRITALLKKMASNGDANEFLANFGYSTDYKGLQKFMDDLSDKNSDKYAGFKKSDAYALGADVSEILKGVRHWDMYGGFKMENGEWKKTSEKEKIMATNNEMFKEHTQSLVRNNNRLAYGGYDENGHWRLSKSGLVTLKLMDNDGGIAQWRSNGQLNAAKFLASKESQDAMRKAGISEELIKAIEERAGGASEESGMNIDGVLKDLEENIKNNESE